MLDLTRRSLLGHGIAGLGALSLPSFALGQADQRPSITIAVQKISNSNTLDPLSEDSVVGARIFRTSLWESLIDFDWLGNMAMQPGLATEWRRIDDTTVEFKLRQGVRFHNGDEMTADDVVFSFGPERMFGDTQPRTRKTISVAAAITVAAPSGKELPGNVSAGARNKLPDLLKVEAVDRYTVRFYNATPDVTLEGRLAGAMNITSRRAWQEAKSFLDFVTHPVTTGPYMVAEFKPNSSLTYVAHDAYWGGRPPLKQIRFVEIPEASGRINGLLSGEYDFASDVPPDQLAMIEANPKLEVQRTLLFNHRIIMFDKNFPQLVDPRIRRAITHSIDRQAIVDTLWGGRTVVPKGLQWDWYGDMYNPDWSVPAYDPELARRLIKEAGYKGDRIPYKVATDYYTNQIATVQAISEMCKANGINVEVVKVENSAQIWGRAPDRAVNDWSNTAFFPDPVSSIVAQHGPNGGQQQNGYYSNDEVATLSDVMMSSTDKAERRKAFWRMMDVLEREDPAYTVLHQNATFIAKKKSMTWKASSASFGMNFRPGNFAI